MATTSELRDAPPDAEVGLPGFSAFCADLHPHIPASIIGYLPLIPASLTGPAVLKEEMKWLIKTSHALGDKYTIITGDQATYELAVAIKDKHRDEFCNVVLLLGGFHQAHNYMKAVCKIIRDAGAEGILVAAGLCQEGTAKKMFGEKAEHYQTMHALRILSGAMWRLYWQAFEACAADRETQHWQSQVEHVVKMLFEKDTTATEKLVIIQMSRPQISILQEQMLLFQESLQFSGQSFWRCQTFSTGSSTTSGKVTGQDISVNQHGCYLTSLQQDTTNMSSSLCLCICLG
ncbi:hypothetical protein CesoFtcFv8_001687 [Champsocephalus esox]|uniref:Uncharacterized protein n=1 Tax=Champsocephalus esox TaxID=159716 RepID=A0AAN8HLC4_9TELE|nr:hypothetical protein CesoFtcFv8_001687 [Champsocephalus esox]